MDHFDPHGDHEDHGSTGRDFLIILAAIVAFLALAGLIEGWPS